MENETLQKIYELRNTCLSYAIQVTPQAIEKTKYVAEVIETAERFYEWITKNKK